MDQYGVGNRFVVANGGNVGIGTSSPDYRLTIAGDSQTRLRIDASTYAGVYLTKSGADAGTIRGNTAGLEFFAPGYGQIMTLTSAGNVGIGTTNPTHLLSVNGAVRAKEVIVDTGWSDYVFKPDYHLAPLTEVQKAIETEGHLPGIPSAKEVAEHGISIGDMQAKLLAKIEELTLHQIEQEKRTAALERENARLQNQVAALQSKLP